MDRYAVIGNPVEHSRSPFIHARFAEQTRQAIEYERVLAPLDGFAGAVRACAQRGLRGCNVTLPFKFEAWALAERLTPRAALAQAVNLLRFDGDGAGWFGDNSDGIGLLRDIEINARLSLAGRSVLLLGAGGAAAGVLGPLLQARPRQLVVANRSAGKAVALVERHAGVARECGVALAIGTGDGPFDVVINATSASLHGGAEDIVSSSALGDGTLVLDMMYGAAAQPFLRWASARGAAARDGLGMLVEQAAESFECWRGVRPATAPVLAALREQLDR